MELNLTEKQILSNRTPLKKRTGFILPPPSNNDVESGKKESESEAADKADCTTPLNPNNNQQQKNGSPSFADRIKDKINVSSYYQPLIHCPPSFHTSVEIDHAPSLFFQNAVPAVMQKEKPREYKLKAFVGFLFLTIVFLVGFAYIFYYQKLSSVCWFIT